jgi:hypothetical protein
MLCGIPSVVLYYRIHIPKWENTMKVLILLVKAAAREEWDHSNGAAYMFPKSVICYFSYLIGFYVNLLPIKK